MTDHQRETINQEVLDAADEQVAKVESEIATLGRLQEDLHASRETIERLSLETLKIRDNDDSIPKEKRMAKLRDNAASLDLEQGDARKITAKINLARTRIVAFGEVAKAAGAAILWALITCRRVNARASLEDLLDMSMLGVLGENLETNARSLLELKELQYYFNHHASADEVDRNIFLLQSLRERFSELRLLCESEQGLTLVAPVIAAPVPIVEAKPATPATLSGVLVAV